MEVQFFEPGTTPEWVTPEWYALRERAPHLEQEGHRGRLLLALSFVADALARYPVATVSDMGCGDGGLLSLLGPLGITAWGYDLQPTNVKAAFRLRKVNARRANFLADSDVVWGDLTVCTEVLEHLIDPHAFVRRIAEHSRIVVASSPEGETAEHRYEFHTWGWDMDGYREMFEQGGFRVMRHESIGFQVLLGVRP